MKRAIFRKLGVLIVACILFVGVLLMGFHLQRVSEVEAAEIPAGAMPINVVLPNGKQITNVFYFDQAYLYFGDFLGDGNKYVDIADNIQTSLNDGLSDANNGLTDEEKSWIEKLEPEVANSPFLQLFPNTSVEFVGESDPVPTLTIDMQTNEISVAETEAYDLNDNGKVDTIHGPLTYDIPIEVQLKNTTGYEPAEGNAVIIAFQQVANAKKYWPDDPNTAATSTENVSEMIPVALSDVRVPLPTTESINQSVKTVLSTDSVVDQLTQPGLYTYIVSQKELGDNVTIGKGTWQTGNEKYLLKVKVEEMPLNGMGEMRKKYQITLAKMADDENLVFPIQKVQALQFSDTLNEQLTTVKLDHVITGKTEIIPANQTYWVSVTISKPAKSMTGVTGFTDSNGTHPFGVKYSFAIDANTTTPITFSNVPVGSTVVFEELGTDPQNSGLLGSNFTSIERRQATGDTDSLKKTGENRQGITSNSYLVTNNRATTDDDYENSFLITDDYIDVINTGLHIASSPFFMIFLVAVLSGVGYYLFKRKIEK